MKVKCNWAVAHAGSVPYRRMASGNRVRNADSIVAGEAYDFREGSCQFLVVIQN
jgi:hypothetical protein